MARQTRILGQTKSTAVVSPNYGLYFDRPAIDIHEKALTDGMNFRIKNGVLSNLNIGWSRFSTGWQLNGPVMAIDNFFPRGGSEYLLFATLKDIYKYEPGSDTVVFLTPIYDAGTASSSGTTVTGVGTLFTANVKIGDEIHFGAADYTNPAGTWYPITNVGGNTTLTISPTSGVVGNGAYTIRKTFVGARNDLWITDTFVHDTTTGDDLWIATNGVDWVVTWDGTAAQVVSHPELGFTCAALATYSNMMIYGNCIFVDDYPTSIINSDVGLPLNAGSTGTGLSEQFQVHDGTDAITSLVPLGDNLAIYSNRHLVLAQFVGDPLVFMFRTAASGIGPIGPLTVADFGDYHEFVSNAGQWTFDGVTVREINTQVWRDIIRQADPMRHALAFGHFDEENSDLLWSIPSTLDAGSGTISGTAETGWAEHYQEKVPVDVGIPFSKRSFPFTASGYYERAVGLTWANAVGTWADFNYSWNDQFFSLAFPQNLVGDNSGYIYILNTSQTGNGVALPSFVHTGRSALGSGRERSLVRRVYPFAQKLSATLNVTTFVSDHAYGPATNAGTIVFDTILPPEGHFVSPFRRGRYVELEYGTAGGVWAIAGWDMDITAGGLR